MPSGTCTTLTRAPEPGTVARDRIELSTFRFSGGRSYQLSYLAGRVPGAREPGEVYRVAAAAS